MTRAQQALIRYAEGNLHETAKPIGADAVRTSGGRILSLNLFGDVIEDGEAVAVSDLGHDLLTVGEGVPTRWSEAETSRKPAKRP